VLSGLSGAALFSSMDNAMFDPVRDEITIVTAIIPY